MSISDLVDDGTFAWIYQGQHSSAATNGVDRIRVDLFEDGFHRCFPMVGATLARLDAAQAKLTDDATRAGRDHLVQFVQPVIAAVAAVI